MAARRPRAPCLLLLLLLLAVEVLSQDDFDLSDALDEKDKPKVSTKQPGAAAGGKATSEDFLNIGTTTKAPAMVTPKAPRSTRQPPKPRTKPAEDDFDLADALDPGMDPAPGDKNKGRGGGFSDQDLVDVGKDSSYKPDKGKGSGGSSNRIDSSDDTNETTAEVGTIAGIVSAVAMALVGAVSSYISYQKKKFCFSIQQSLNTEMNKNESPEGVVATEPQA